MKKLLLIIAAIYIIFCFTACETLISVLDEPVVSLHSVDIVGVNFNGTQLLCKVQIDNPNGFEIPFPEINWQLFLNSNSLINGTVKNSQRLRARNSTIVEVPVGFEFLQAFNAITSLKGKDSANYKIALALKFPIPIIGDKVWRMEFDGNIPLPQLPKLATPRISFERMDLSGTTIVFSVNVQNPNSFELPAPKIDFDFQINRTSIVNSSTTAAEALRPNSTTPVSMRFTVYQADLVRILGASLLTTGTISCNLSASFDFGIPAFGNEPITIQVPGTFPLR